MKICWDNIKNLIYDKEKEIWIKYIYYNSKRGNQKYIYVDECGWCHEPFLSLISSPGLFCCRSCGIRHKQTGKISPLKGKKISRRHVEKIRCANSCKIRTVEMRKRYSISKRGSNNPMYGVKGKDHPRCGVKNGVGVDTMMEGLRDYLKKKGLPYNTKGHPFKNTKRPDFSGENSPNWKGGVTSVNESLRKSIEYINWRNAVFEKDDYICIRCGIKGGRLVAHHNVPLNVIINDKLEDLLFDIDNGSTMCKNHHVELHSLNGYKYVEDGLERK